MARNFEDYEANPFAAPQSDLTPERYQSRGAEPNYSGFWRRFAAAFVDGIILNIIGFVIGLAIGAAMGPEGVASQSGQIMLNVVGFIIGWVYCTTQEASEAGATLGKKALGIRVTNLDGDRITFGQANGRYFGKIVSALILLIGYLMQPFTARKQALHDMMAGTLVVKT